MAGDYRGVQPDRAVRRGDLPWIAKSTFLNMQVSADGAVGEKNMFLDRLRRVTRDGRWIPEVDGLRFVAISSVFLYHVMQAITLGSVRISDGQTGYWWIKQLLDHGDRGVMLFFVISGMILAMPFARSLLLGAKPVSLRKYYMRRVTRLEPPYIASMVVAVLGYLVVWHKLVPGGLPHLLASVFYQHNLFFGTNSTVNPVAWSLEVEIQFYLLAPLVMQSYRIRRAVLRRALLLLGVVLISLAYTLAPPSPRLELSILFYLQYFLMGLLVADIFVLDLATMKSTWIWDLVGVAALGWIFWPARTAIWQFALIPIPMGALCVAAMRSHGLRRVIANPWVAVTGGMCYSIYLLHYGLIFILYKATKLAAVHSGEFFVNYVVQLSLLTIPVMAICVLFFLLVERPCMDPNWPSKLWHALTGRRGGEVAVLDAGGISE
jgi:peptidoglycan/LPS O-acetylase OafA/YrhL